MRIAQIVAVAQNGVIGKDNDLIWRLSNDLKYFKNITTGHHIIMGRKNYESIGRPLPNRTSIIITRNPNYKAEGCIVVNSLEKAIEIAKTNGDDEAFIIGGGEIYNMSMNLVNRIYYTEVHESFEGDTFYPELDKSTWNEISREKHSSDEKNAHDYSFVIYDSKK